MIANQIHKRRLGQMLLPSALAILLLASLVLLLSSRQIRAQRGAGIAQAELEAEKQVSATEADPGDTLQYTLTVRDIDDPAGTVWLTDPLPAELRLITESLSANFGSLSFGKLGADGGVITWTADLYGAGQTAVIYFSAEISPDIECTTIVNRAYLEANGEQIATPPVETTVSGSAGHLQVTKSVVPDGFAEPGDVLTFTIEVRDTEQASGLVWLTDALPAELILDADSVFATMGQWGVQSNTITWTATMYGYGQTGIVRFGAQVSPDVDYEGWITNTAQVVAACQSIAESAGVYVYQGQPQLEASKSADAEWRRPEEPLNFAVSIRNTGDGSAGTVWMTDALPTGLSYTGNLSATTGKWGVANDVITWTGSLAPSDTVTVSFSTQVDSSTGEGTLTNTAQITGAGSLVQASVGVDVIVTFTLYLPVTPRNYPPTLSLHPIPTMTNQAYAVTWNDLEIAYDRYVLQESQTADFAQPTRVWTTSLNSQVVENGYCPFYYRVRADDADRWGTGPWSNVQRGSSTKPEAPVLDDVSEAYWNRSFVVSWSPVSISVPGVVLDRYVLQESTDPNFASVRRQWVTTQLSQTLEPTQSYDRLYYRVRADDDDCWGQGPWSESTSADLHYFDDFSLSNSGWPKKEVLVIPSSSTYYRLRYEAGQYRIMVDAGGPPIWFHQPDALAPYRPPSNQYCVEVDVKIEKAQPPYQNWNYYPFWGNGGLIFGANDQNTSIYAVCLTIGMEDEMGWLVVNNPIYTYPYKGCNYVQGVVGGEGGVLDVTQWHKFQASVDGDRVTLYIDGSYKGEWNMYGLAGTTQVGLVGGDYEVTPVDFRFDNFRVTPGQACTP